MWNSLWQLKIPPKYTNLLWCILQNGIPVRYNLYNRGLLSDPLCPRCTESIEDIAHVFMGCDWAKQMWFASSLTIKMENNNKSFIDWITQMLSSLDKESMAYNAALIY